MTPRKSSPRKPQGGALASMPDEVLMKIWLLLAEPTNFPLICKSIREFTQRPDVRAKYFLSRHGRYLAMFHAMACPKLFDEALCQSLVDSGAHISLALMQELSKQRRQVVSQSILRCCPRRSFGGS
ncbi:hypothetical protein BCV69DRAFT_147836 [Microstroma glucosiphilum]|uniref:F-box domain-containing protein n=1 Tax=Pseudomicrostroma glucosiphilum TaxID=1684307 RepID=A0A316UFA2_9BASI|nr:hypothetical protein BCV69DRAFT_147836 [Pseudomicrostroma glucosiphilum]PWN22573.1 hypothetical protein BCV69DRAFT_147836 [Pseudomicrostroma glucosiphilum]